MPDAHKSRCLLRLGWVSKKTKKREVHLLGERGIGSFYLSEKKNMCRDGYFRGEFDQRGENAMEMAANVCFSYGSIRTRASSEIFKTTIGGRLRSDNGRLRAQESRSL